MKKIGRIQKKLQKLLYNFQARFTVLLKLKPCLSFLVNPFETDVVTSECPIAEPWMSEAL